MDEILRIEKLTAGYGHAVVLEDVSLELGSGQSLALLGRNGTGKTTLINTIVGVTRRFGGSIQLGDAELTRLRPHDRAARGVGWCPQERNVFRSLTVEENLSAVARPGPWDTKRIFAMFPRLSERQRNFGAQLSGGEQQMLAVGRALATNPKLLLLDEPLEGLAPIIVAELLSVLRDIIRQQAMSVVLVEQNAAQILPLTDSAVILDRGRIVHRSASDALLGDKQALERFLGIARAPERA